MSNGKGNTIYRAGGETSEFYNDPLTDAYVKKGGAATGKIGDYEHFSGERIAEYDARGWKYDHTTHKPREKGSAITVKSRGPVKPYTYKDPGMEKTLGGKGAGNNTKTTAKTTANAKKTGKVGAATSAAAKSDPGAFGQIAQGLAKTAGSLVGGGKRRREQRAANKELKQRKQAYEDFEMKNVHADATNPYEDLKVNTQEAEFMAQQSQQGLANTLGSLSATAGGSGIAALAQTMAGQQSMNIQRAGASIGMQESRNEAQRAAGEERRQVRMAQGEQNVQEFNLGRTENLFEQAGIRKQKADDARDKATKDLVGGIADTVTGVGRVVAAAYTGGGSELAIEAGKVAAKKIAAKKLENMAKKGIKEVGNYAIDKA